MKEYNLFAKRTLCTLTPQSRNTIRPSIRAKNRRAILPLAKAAKPCSRCCTTRYSKVNPEAPFVQQPLFDQCLIVCICKVETNIRELLFTNFVINTKAVWEKMLHCISQVTRAATKFNAIKTSLPQPGRIQRCVCSNVINLRLQGPLP